MASSPLPPWEKALLFNLPWVVVNPSSWAGSLFWPIVKIRFSYFEFQELFVYFRCVSSDVFLQDFLPVCGLSCSLDIVLTELNLSIFMKSR